MRGEERRDQTHVTRHMVVPCQNTHTPLNMLRLPTPWQNLVTTGPRHRQKKKKTSHSTQAPTKACYRVAKRRKTNATHCPGHMGNTFAAKLRAAWPRTTHSTTAPARQSPAATSLASPSSSPTHLAASRAVGGSTRACQRNQYRSIPTSNENRGGKRFAVDVVLSRHDFGRYMVLVESSSNNCTLNGMAAPTATARTCGHQRRRARTAQTVADRATTNSTQRNAATEATATEYTATNATSGAT